ncbi:hypothetical protein A8H37_01420 [Burkholderia thailandensis]|nr:hypothetical protein A8H37_01420 [Burkholderia thailandensis]
MRNAARCDRAPFRRRGAPRTGDRPPILRTFGPRSAGPHLTCIRKSAARVCKAVLKRRMRAVFSGGASDENGQANQAGSRG